MENKGLCAVKFGATWCGPCKLIEPSFEKMKSEFPSVKFESVNVDDNPSLAKKYQIRNLPTVILLKDGHEVSRLMGSTLITPLRKAFKDLVKDEAA